MQTHRPQACLIRYLLFYLAFIIVLSLFTYLLDLIFYGLYYDTTEKYRYNVVQYIRFYIIIGYLFFPLLVFYNYLINAFLPDQLLVRIIAGVLTSIALCFLISFDLQYGYYIGEHRALKNVLAFALTGLAIELLRYLVVLQRIRKKENR